MGLLLSHPSSQLAAAPEQKEEEKEKPRRGAQSCALIWYRAASDVAETCDLATHPLEVQLHSRCGLESGKKNLPIM